MYYNFTIIRSIKSLLLLFFIIIISVSCEHCDDEDYTREAKEQTALKHSHSSDTLLVINN